mgnify:CR=1 FL=1
MKDNLKYKWGIAAGVLITIVVNMLAVLLPLNGKSTASISDQFQVYFVPANYVFSIWSLIYLGLIGFTIYQFVLKPAQYKIVKEIAPAVILTGVFNSIWLFMWHYEYFAWTLPLMIALLVSLIFIVVKLQKVKESDKPRFFDLLIKLPFSIYIGWITVATVANATDILYLLQFNGFGMQPQLWAAIMMLIAGILGLIGIKKNGDFAYAAVIVWAVTGIGVKFSNEFIITTAAIAVACFLLIGALLKQFYPRKGE